MPAALLELRPRVRRRVGVDLDPVDVTTDEGALRLRSFVWPGQEGRLERLDQAIEAVRRAPPRLVPGDLVEVLPKLLAARDRTALTIVFQTAVLGYLPDERLGTRSRLARRGGPRRDRLPSSGLPGRQSASTTTGDCGCSTGRAREPELVAHADFHGAWLEWLA